MLEGMEERRTPLSNWIQEAVRQYMGNTAYNSEQYDLVFDKMEILMALSCGYHEKRAKGWFWAPIGSFVRPIQYQGTGFKRD